MTNLVTLAEYKAYAGINSDTQDAVINILIPKVSELVKTYCGRTFIDHYDDPITEYSDGNIQYIYLKESPLVSILSMEYSLDYGATYTNLVEFTDYVINNQYGRVEAIASTGFPYYLNGYKITYTGGYVSTPEDLKLACLDLVAYYIKNDMSIKSTRGVGSNNTSVEFITTASMPSHIRRVLDLYRETLI